jgi:2-octaprenyl-6-methoxyphenol hydroxylase
MKNLQKTVVIGGGIVGLMTALALHRAGCDTLLLESKEFRAPSKPCRLLSIALGSCRIIEELTGVQVEQFGQPIHKISIMQQSSAELLAFNPQEVGLKHFGVMVDEVTLLASLYTQVEKTGLAVRHTKASDILHGIHQDSVILQDGSRYEASLVIVADGKNSHIRKKLGIENVEKQYHHTALVCEVRHTKPHHGTATENFTPQGSFGILPQLSSDISSIVWSLPNHLAEVVMALEVSCQLDLLVQRIPDYLGDIVLESTVKAYPLSLVYANEYQKGRCVLLGDALHSIHPLAGQGLNLSIRDMKYVVRATLEAQRLGLDIGNNAMLQQYHKHRYTDNQLMVESTHLLHHLFANNSAILSKIRQVGARMLGHMPLFKHFIMLYAAGMKEL